MSWTPPPVETDPDAATRRILTAVRARIPGHETHEGDPITILAEEIGRETANLGQTTGVALEEAIAGIGQTVFRVPVTEATRATATVRIHVATDGTIPAGFTVLGTTPAGEDIAFTAEEITATTPHVDVTMTAVTPGAAANSVPVGPSFIVTATAIVIAAEFTAAPTGGADPESRTAYLSRLTAYLGTLRPGGVTADDMAALARSVPGVHRALGVDLYDPSAPSAPTERTATVVCVDAQSRPVDPEVKTVVRDLLESAREVNFVVHVADPTYTPVAIVYEAVAEAGADPAVIKSAIDEVLETWLTHWGTTAVTAQAWIDTPTVRLLDVARVAGSVAGVAYLQSITINGTAHDLPLPGPAALPALLDATVPSTVTGSVV